MAVTMPSVPTSSNVLSPNRTPNRTPVQQNIASVVLGNTHIKPWYPSFYPEGLVGGRKTEKLYVCQWCFRYTDDVMKYSAHCKVCPLKDEAPPGDLIYENDDYIIHHIDGEEHKLYAQNLSLLSKLFLDNKSVFFDVSTFLYYPLILKTSAHPYGQVVGFFSKEKMSWDNNNVACILIFPPWQKRGLGQILIAASYELGRREKRFGGPERPLSELGRKGYISYWSGEVYRCLVASPLERELTVKDISDETYILQEDVVAALREMDVLEKDEVETDGAETEAVEAEGSVTSAQETRKAANTVVVLNKRKLRAWAASNRVSAEPIIDVDAFVEDESDEEEEESEEEE
ncbi:hypothetical protein LTR08_000644 [Meristemomyces frigidus]|nr:hypothetical protein LTR08_000644 [Meristemomyces frigidus]